MVSDYVEQCLPLVTDRERRELVQLLRRGGSTKTSVHDLLDAVLRDSGEEFDRRRSKRTAIRLCHVHLPALAAQNIVEYDPDAGTVRYRSDERFEELLDLLDTTAMMSPE